jgi:hypothetical protein
MSEATQTTPDQDPLERGFTDRRPLTSTFLVIESSLLILAAVLFAIGDPMSPNPTTASVVGGLVLMMVLMLAAIGVFLLLGTSIIKLYTSIK